MPVYTIVKEKVNEPKITDKTIGGLSWEYFPGLWLV